MEDCLYTIFLRIYPGEKVFLGILKQKISRWVQYLVSEAVQQKTSRAVMSEFFFLWSCFYQPQSFVNTLPILHSLVQIPSPSREALRSPQLELITLPSIAYYLSLLPKHLLVPWVIYIEAHHIPCSVVNPRKAWASRPSVFPSTS